VLVPFNTPANWWPECQTTIPGQLWLKHSGHCSPWTRQPCIEGLHD